MCHEWWMHRMQEEREAGRELWDEFDQTRPLSDPAPAEAETEIRVEHPEPEPVAER